MAYVQVEVDIEDHISELDSFDMIIELQSRAKELDRVDIEMLKKILATAGISNVEDSLEEALKNEEWQEVKDHKTSMQWREFFQNMGNAVTA